jgi:drug/metabolite transporter (DMT)-like permease
MLDPTLHRPGGGPRRGAVAHALAVGALIGAYTVWDAQLVARLAVPPLVVEWVLDVAIALYVTPAALRDRRALGATWRAHRGAALLGSAFSAGSYVLFLTALATAPVTRAAPAREVSILIGAALGTHALAEGEPLRRLAAAGAISLGVALLALG